MIGDFDGSSNALWTLYRDEAKSHDDARLSSLKDDMDGDLIFVCTYLIYTYEPGHNDVCPAGRFIFCCPHYIHNR